MPSLFQLFISHFASEHKIAEHLQDFFAKAFPSVSIFRSSDAASIETAQGQYEAIIDALRAASVTIVLLSSESARRPWMPFETGFAMGREAKVFTLLVRGAKPHELPSPFKEMQLRPINHIEIEKVMSAIESTANVKRVESLSVDSLLEDIRKAELALPNMVLKLEAHMMKYPPGCFSFRVIYEGHENVILKTMTAGIPFATKDPSWAPHTVNGHLDVQRCDVHGVDYFFMQYAAGPPPVLPFPPSTGLNVVQPILYAPKDYKDLFELRFAIRNDINVFQDQNLIRCWIETEKFRTDVQLIPMSELRAT
jgi:hypothetical protein